MIGATIAKDLGPDARVPLIGLRLGESTTIEQRVSLSGFSTLLDLGDGAFSQQSRISDISVSGSVMARGEAHDRSIGYELATQRVRYASGSTKTGTSDYDLQQRPASAAAWIGDLWRISPKWIVEGGLRGEALRDRQWAALSPRLSVKYFRRAGIRAHRGDRPRHPIAALARRRWAASLLRGLDRQRLDHSGRDGMALDHRGRETIW